MAIDVPSSRMQNSEAALAECTELEAEIAGLRAAYEQYFSGIERIAPLKRHEALKKRLAKLKSSFIKQTAVKFRVNGLYAKYLTYERQWAKTMEQRENGTYRPDLERARRRSKLRDEQEQRKQVGGAAMRGTVELDPSEDVDLDDFDFGDDDDGPSAAPAAKTPPPAARAAAPTIEVDEFDALLDALSESEPPSPAPRVTTAPAAVSAMGGVVRGPVGATSGALGVSASGVRGVSIDTQGGVQAARGPAGSGGLPAVARPAPGAAGLGQPRPLDGAPVAGATPASSPASARPTSSPSIAAVARPTSSPAVAAVARSISGAAIPAVARPVGAAGRPTSGVGTPPGGRPSSPGAVSDQKLKAVYDAYVMAKRRCNEDTSQLSFEKVAGELRREVGQLTREGGARAVEFKVVIKDGRAQLRTVPKE